ncbi:MULTISPECIES: acetolactate synthase small subunit [Thermodesulfovibrio]|uniref:Acetolactate synthase small subunit n=2 Tax=Thermodesulfovibrio yellowstonii TaxID=28262 RepID=B5YFP2_THEYD|nr:MULTISPECIES: acetolactate synthase small subunit [Thermodesulfovibrio]ACI20444.1 acetolactate synthase, small subunit [Thermodesulfovibrio yellowstonii DSM 11347]MDI6864901.1 acetolactate synthase small subunit [Thermodesulfovibrio yellowstonii]GLI53316.1 acetolactate synthase small subunit [Thermodesulfovibrio islandicus]
MRHTISVLVENKFGVLARIAGLFSGRGYNIESLSVGETIDPNISIMTIVTTGDDRVIEQITKQLNRLVDVIKVVDLTEIDHVEREMVLIKVAPRKENRLELLKTVEIFRGRVVDSGPTTYTIEVTGDEKKIQAFIELMKPLGIKEFVRTGKVAIPREISQKKQ